MPSTCSFIPALKEFLKTNGCIYTVRKYLMSDNEVLIDGLEGIYQRTFIKRIKYPLDLIPFASQSGFRDLGDWIKKISQFIPCREDPWYLYRVEKKV